MKSLISPFGKIYNHRDILFRTTANEFRFKYAGSAMGSAWYVLSPLLLMTLYTVIYLAIFKVRVEGMTGAEYVLYVFSGLIPFLGFSESLTAGSTSLSLNKAVLLNTVFPAELAPLRSVLVSQGSAAVGLVVTVIAACFLGKLSIWIIFLPLIWISLTLFVMGLVWVLALASLVLKDIQHILAFVSMALLIATPIAYTREMVPKIMSIVVYVNPLSYYVICFQDVILYQRPPTWWVFVISLLLGVTNFCLGFWVFQRAKKVFFDYA